MSAREKIFPDKIVGPLGELLSIDDLPPPSTRRWTPRRKAEVVAAVNGKLLSIEEVCGRYALSLEELVGWQRAEERAGLPGLRATKLQHYRERWERVGAK